MSGNELCHEHSGVKTRVEVLESSMKILFSRTDKITTLLIVSLVTLVLNLLGVVAILAKS
jgi:hypothetical protein